MDGAPGNAFQPTGPSSSRRRSRTPCVGSTMRCPDAVPRAACADDSGTVVDRWRRALAAAGPDEGTCRERRRQCRLTAAELLSKPVEQDLEWPDLVDAAQPDGPPTEIKEDHVRLAAGPQAIAEGQACAPIQTRVPKGPAHFAFQDRGGVFGPPRSGWPQQQPTQARISAA